MSRGTRYLVEVMLRAHALGGFTISFKLETQKSRYSVMRIKWKSRGNAITRNNKRYNEYSGIPTSIALTNEYYNL